MVSTNSKTCACLVILASSSKHVWDHKTSCWLYFRIHRRVPTVATIVTFGGSLLWELYANKRFMDGIGGTNCGNNSLLRLLLYENLRKPSRSLPWVVQVKVIFNFFDGYIPVFYKISITCPWRNVCTHCVTIPTNK